MDLRHLLPKLDQFNIHHLKENVHPTTIARLVLKSCGKVITVMAIYQYRDTADYSILKSTCDLLYGTPVERLIAKFTKTSDVSFVYVTHDIKSKFLSYQKRRDDNIATQIDDDSTEYIFVY